MAQINPSDSNQEPAFPLPTNDNDGLAQAGSVNGASDDDDSTENTDGYVQNSNSSPILSDANRVAESLNRAKGAQILEAVVEVDADALREKLNDQNWFTGFVGRFFQDNRLAAGVLIVSPNTPTAATQDIATALQEAIARPTSPTETEENPQQEAQAATEPTTATEAAEVLEPTLKILSLDSESGEIINLALNFAATENNETIARPGFPQPCGTFDVEGTQIGLNPYRDSATNAPQEAIFGFCKNTNLGETITASNNEVIELLTEALYFDNERILRINEDGIGGLPSHYSDAMGQTKRSEITLISITLAELFKYYGVAASNIPNNNFYNNQRIILALARQERRLPFHEFASSIIGVGTPASILFGLAYYLLSRRKPGGPNGGSGGGGNTYNFNLNYHESDGLGEEQGPIDISGSISNRQMVELAATTRLLINDLLDLMPALALYQPGQESPFARELQRSVPFLTPQTGVTLYDPEIETYASLLNRMLDEVEALLAANQTQAAWELLTGEFALALASWIETVGDDILTAFSVGNAPVVAVYALVGAIALLVELGVPAAAASGIAFLSSQIEALIARIGVGSLLRGGGNFFRGGGGLGLNLGHGALATGLLGGLLEYFRVPDNAISDDNPDLSIFDEANNVR